MALDKKQIAKFKAQAHSLKPVVLLGGKGLTPAVINEINAALDAHELIKVKITGDDRDARRAVIDEICAQTQAELVQVMGHVATLYRKNMEK
jgi:RNA-binding protein